MHLPFQLNFGKAPLTCEQKARLIDIIYKNQNIFLLHDEHLGFCDQLSVNIQYVRYPVEGT